MIRKSARGFPTVQQSPTQIRSKSAECSYGGVEHIARCQPASDPDRLEAATDQTIAACDGNVRQAVKALIVANEFLVAHVAKLQAAVSNGYARGKFEAVPHDREDWYD